MNSVRDNLAEHRFELAVDSNGEFAAAYYRPKGDRIVLTHTEVPEQFSGKGIASQLARGVFEALRAAGRKAILVCPFMTAFYARHPEYSDVVDDTAQQEKTHD
ncbi:GNAT family N-acetyltransferase [Bradyrhizobium tunisiense]|uniref:GNAT family N-acetyltransferase n=1 Tax=Bradyrhizobium tunisiense TaxID=3278709 RepID=UPI0035DE64D8